MQIILSGLTGDVTEDSIHGELSRFFHVVGVRLVREGDGDSPWALVEVCDPYAHVWNKCNQLRGVFHRGKRLHFYIPMHQEEQPYELLHPHERIDIA
jgi:hypothetical protein